MGRVRIGFGLSSSKTLIQRTRSHILLFFRNLPPNILLPIERQKLDGKIYKKKNRNFPFVFFSFFLRLSNCFAKFTLKLVSVLYECFSLVSPNIDHLDPRYFSGNGKMSS